MAPLEDLDTDDLRLENVLFYDSSLCSQLEKFYKQKDILSSSVSLKNHILQIILLTKLILTSPLCVWH